ncbi:uncharacterized protein EDB93DRAFT_1178624 [Suillus bovinus]|uniref:uncharacterized protein n=1 Tax=Suillus bovinus TaxID=48563 RepID=UPI001B869B8C|nr:uncharacterized protein EDB93DRAFT_1178624 [Suillus bovinus]KAG2131244.1 hypothetical protein EDB93DRAFT_1178624 [Suillus bovinus]
MSFTTPVQMTYPCYHYRPLPFVLDPHAPQYDREQCEGVLALYLRQKFGNQPTRNTLHAQEYDESPNQTRMMQDVLPRTRMSEVEDFDTQFLFDSDNSRKNAEIQRANRAIRDQAVREHEATTREWHDFAAFQAQFEKQRLFPHHHLYAENFLAGTVNQRCSHMSSNYTVSGPDEPSLKDMISSHLMEERRLMAEHRSEVRDMLQAILVRLSKGTTIEAPVKCDHITTLTATSTSVNEEGPRLSQEGKEKANEITDSDAQEEAAASPVQVASSISQISSVAARLENLLAVFQFPVELDFSSALGTADVFALTYTPANAPVRAQEHALSLLFADLDNIPSFGSDVVRNARRAVVTRVDQALQELDKGVEERRRRACAKKAIPVTQSNDGDPSEPSNATPADVVLAQVPVVDEVPI